MFSSFAGNSSGKLYLSLLVWLLVLGISPYYTRLSYSLPLTSNINFCVSDEDCDDFMMCLDNSCICDTYHWDTAGLDQDKAQASQSHYSEASSCTYVRLIGESCNNQTEICPRGSFCIPSIETSSSHKNSTGICTCPHGFEPDAYGEECKRSYGFSCDQDQQLCNPSKFYACSLHSNTCQCHNAPTVLYDPNKNSCVAKPGGSCELHSWMKVQLGCGQAAICQPIEKENDNDHFYGICKCLPGFYPPENASHPGCIPIYGKYCSGLENDCANDENFQCVENQCVCTKGRVYESPSNEQKLGGECKVPPNSPCLPPFSYGRNDSKGKFPSCVENASCELENDTFICKCRPGYMAASDGSCQLGLGFSPCHKTNKKCHQDSGLICLHDKCSCGPDQRFDHVTGSCRILQNALCSNGQDAVKCVTHSFCDELTRTCKCHDSFYPQTDGQCVAGLKTTCNSSFDECPKDSGLVCDQEQGICSCPLKSGQIYDSESRSCQLKAGEFCSPHPSKNQCIQRAFCDQNNVCKCLEGFALTSDGDCLIGYDKKCSSELASSGVGQFIDSCNKFQGLHCINGRCLCLNESYVFNTTSENCEILPSSNHFPGNLLVTDPTVSPDVGQNGAALIGETYVAAVELTFIVLILIMSNTMLLPFDV